MDVGRMIAMVCAGWLVLSGITALVMMWTCFENRRRKETTTWHLKKHMQRFV